MVRLGPLTTSVGQVGKVLEDCALTSEAALLLPNKIPDSRLVIANQRLSFISTSRGFLPPSIAISPQGVGDGEAVGLAAQVAPRRTLSTRIGVGVCCNNSVCSVMCVLSSLCEMNRPRRCNDGRCVRSNQPEAPSRDCLPWLTRQYRKHIMNAPNLYVEKRLQL